MKRTIYAIMAVISLLAASCAKDGDMLTATMTGDGTQIGSTDDNIVLDIDAPSSLALTIYWDALGNATLSNPDAQFADDFVVNAIQFSATEDFSVTVEETVDNDASFIQYTAMRLNSIVTRLGLESGVAGTVYIRMRSSLGTGDGAEVTFGNTISITVTPYFIDMSFITLTGTNDGTELTVPAGQEDGTYAGFVNVPTSWWNFFFSEGDGTIWGTVPDSGAFLLEEKADMSSWNAWFPDPSGCYYVNVNITEGQWECSSLSSVTVTPEGGDATAMRYSAETGSYSATFMTSADNVPLQVEYAGTIYNNEYGDSSTESTSAAFIGNADGSLSLGTSGTASGMTATGAAGTYTLTLNLTDMTWSIEEGGDITVTYPESISVYYYTSGTQGELAAVLGSTGEGIYEGFLYNDVIDWTEGRSNFRFHVNIGGEDIVYGYHWDDATGGDQYALSDEPTGDFWSGFESSGVTYSRIRVDLINLTWSESPIDQVYLSGTFNSWSTTANPMTYDFDTRTWSGTCIFTEENYTDGAQMIFDDSTTDTWDYRYHGYDGTVYEGDGGTQITAPGTWTISINVSDMTNLTYSVDPAE